MTEQVNVAELIPLAPSKSAGQDSAPGVSSFSPGPTPQTPAKPQAPIPGLIPLKTRAEQNPKPKPEELIPLKDTNGGIMDAFYGGLRAGPEAMGQTAAALRGEKIPKAEAPKDYEQPYAWTDDHNPELFVKKTIYQITSAVPEIGGAAVGASVLGFYGQMAGGGAENPLGLAAGVGGGIMGTFLGAQLVNSFKTLGPYYYEAKRAGLSDDAAWSKASKQALTSGVVSGASMALFKFNPYEAALKNLLAQTFAQTGMAAAGTGLSQQAAGEKATIPAMAAGAAQVPVQMATGAAAAHVLPYVAKRSAALMDTTAGQKAGRFIDRVVDSGSRLFNPLERSEGAEAVGRTERAMRGEMYHDMHESKMEYEKYEKMADSMTKEEHLAFIELYEERGREQKPGETSMSYDYIKQGVPKAFEPMAESIKGQYKKRKETIQGLAKEFGADWLNEGIDDMLTHLVKQPDDSIFTKALEHRKYRYVSDLYKAGHELATTNPIKLAIIGLEAQDRFIQSRRTILAARKMEQLKFFKFDEDLPEGWRFVDDKAVRDKYHNPNATPAENRKQAEKLGLPAPEATFAGKGPEQEMGPRDPYDMQFHMQDQIPGEGQRRITDEKGKQGRAAGTFPREQYLAPWSLEQPKLEAPERKALPPPHAGVPGEPIGTELGPEWERGRGGPPAIRQEGGKKAPSAEEKAEDGPRLIWGRWAAPEPVAVVLERAFANPGWFNKNIPDLYNFGRGLNNWFNSEQLIGVFHLMNVSSEAMMSSVSNGLGALAKGQGGRGVKSLAKTPLAPYFAVKEGRRVGKAYEMLDKPDEFLKAFGTGLEADEYKQLAQMFKAAGGQMKMPEAHKIINEPSTWSRVLGFKSEGGLERVSKFVPRMSQLLMSPIMEKYVPAAKIGVWSEMIRRELAANPEMKGTDVLRTAQKKLDIVEDRLGEMNFDNLYWQKTMVQAAWLGFRSFTWQFGNLRVLGGGLKDWAQQGTRFARGEGFELTDRMTYLAGILAVNGISAAVYQRLMTGEGPSEAMDFLFPKDGTTDKYGNPGRRSMWGLMKWGVNFLDSPLHEAYNAASPLIQDIMMHANNKDYQGGMISEDSILDNPLSSIAQHLEFELRDKVPFSLQRAPGGGHTWEGDPGAISSSLGVNIAPYAVRVPSEIREAQEKYREAPALKKKRQREQNEDQGW